MRRLFHWLRNKLSRGTDLNPLAVQVVAVRGGVGLVVELPKAKELILLLPRARALALIDTMLDAMGAEKEPETDPEGGYDA